MKIVISISSVKMTDSNRVKIKSRNLKLFRFVQASFCYFKFLWKKNHYNSRFRKTLKSTVQDKIFTS